MTDIIQVTLLVLGGLLIAEATRSLPTVDGEVETPLTTAPAAGVGPSSPSVATLAMAVCGQSLKAIAAARAASRSVSSNSGYILSEK